MFGSRSHSEENVVRFLKHMPRAYTHYSFSLSIAMIFAASWFPLTRDFKLTADAFYFTVINLLLVYMKISYKFQFFFLNSFDKNIQMLKKNYIILPKKTSIRFFSAFKPSTSYITCN